MINEAYSINILALQIPWNHDEKAIKAATSEYCQRIRQILENQPNEQNYAINKLWKSFLIQWDSQRKTQRLKDLSENSSCMEFFILSVMSISASLISSKTISLKFGASRNVPAWRYQRRIDKMPEAQCRKTN